MNATQVGIPPYHSFTPFALERRKISTEYHMIANTEKKYFSIGHLVGIESFTSIIWISTSSVIYICYAQSVKLPSS